MNPRDSLEDCDTLTARGYVSLFREHGDLFQFAVDGYDDMDERRAYIIEDDFEHDGQTTVGMTVINDETAMSQIKSAMIDMGFSMLESGMETGTTIDGEEEYQGFYLTATVDSANQSWNVPHLVVYGSLRPEIEEICSGLSDVHDVEYCNIRNHYVLFGDDVTETMRDTLSDRIQARMVQEEAETYCSDVRTADLV